MSRRESRASNGVRQADALAEYENLKKKFLLANKHITKLNSTLSIRIEELNTEITVLQVENLRLRQSEISLLAQLKREREKSRKVIADTEAATLHLTKHLAYLRHTFNISLEPTPPPSPAFPPATKPPAQTTNACIPGLRIAKPPNVPGIREEEEPCASSSDGELEDKPSSGKRKSKSKSNHRLSASKLPLPPRATSPPAPMAHHSSRITDYQTSSSSSSSSSSATATTKRKNSRRQSGLLSIDTENLAPPRPASPAFGSPIRLEAARAEEAEEIAVMSGNLEVDAELELQDGFDQPQLPPPVPKKEKKRTSKSKDKDPSPPPPPPPPPNADDDRGEREYAIESMRSREKKRQREDDLGDLPLEGTKGKPRDTIRAVLQPVDYNTGYLTTAIRVKPNSVRDKEEVVVSARTFLVTSAPTIPPPAPPEPESDLGAGGRERRVRKSINYAEPKLNTKMRKPDPPSGPEPPTRKKRSSAAAVMTTATYPKVPEPPSLLTNVDRDTPERRFSGEFLSRDIPDSMSPEMYPLPPSRPSSSIGMAYHSPISDSQPPSAASRTSSIGGGSGNVGSSSSTGIGSLRRKKSKPVEIDDEDRESDGADADGEYVPPRGGLGAWVNVEGRGSRKSSSERPKKGTLAGVGIMLSEVRRDLADDSRRRSMAV